MDAIDTMAADSPPVGFKTDAPVEMYPGYSPAQFTLTERGTSYAPLYQEYQAAHALNRNPYVYPVKIKSGARTANIFVYGGSNDRTFAYSIRATRQDGTNVETQLFIISHARPGYWRLGAVVELARQVAAGLAI